MEEKIDWNKFQDQYVRIEMGIEKKVKLTNWKGGELFGKPAIIFDVTQEDSKVVEKQLTVTSRRLIRELKPILQDLEQKGQDEVVLSILRTGDGMNTKYTVRELPKSLKELFR